MMRVFLALFLCLIVAFQGSVSAHAFQMPCPMDHAGGQTASVDESAQVAGDCCNDAETAAKTGKLCKTDIPCSSASACVLPSFHVHTPSAQASAPEPALSGFIASFDPSGVWRPPSLS
ncbi:hypothetical protein ACUHMQ_13355 [Chitinimonas sp. PSY-7]|uniref:hypothetical protein n=1 Tax=Chitinimonas sp. PSY-7 TaxID=3459088 RepID=UPI0040403E0E